ncbi:von Willebrand factor type A domain protein [Polystyrenella longa]|uniref:von Willebrand factor type A domain protein n=1 Tax=Polystyrenella longa TaxID=2528007 RepID=A0A518CPB0_9PLAN|nr:pilus assembly protein TadG-related protein [Polystyrenella longa]QDU81066.1 von Willebrand factor type A domain protein [Polystyrenella longa]
MKTKAIKTQTSTRDQVNHDRRKGAFMAFTLFILIATAGFLSMSIDLSVVTVTRTRMQNTADAAALAASQEISIALDELSGDLGQGGDVGGGVQDANVYAQQRAKDMAEEIVTLNGFYLDPDRDVEFGQRVLDDDTGEASIVWGQSPFNTVKVTVRKSNPDKDAPDAKLDLFFAKMLDEENIAIEVNAIAYIDARDLVVVMDFSGSMNYDSLFRSDSISKLGQPAIETNLQNIWNDLGSPTYGNMGFANDFVTIPEDSSNNPDFEVTWKHDVAEVTSDHPVYRVKIYFESGGSQQFNLSNVYSYNAKGTGSKSGRVIDKLQVRYRKNNSNVTKTIDFYDDDDLKRGLDLSNVSYPYPSGSWNDFLDHCLNDSDIERAGHERTFGMMNLIHYWMDERRAYSQTPDLYKVRHYPFHAVKEGGSLLCNYLDSLDFGDHLGLVTYDTYHRVESVLVSDGWVQDSVDISSDPITDNYAAINTIQRNKQAAHYYATTNVGGGLSRAIDLLDAHGRYGAQKTILLMTDGNANTSDNNWDYPPGFDMDELTDYNGDGTADYTTSNTHKKFTFAMAKKAIDKDYTIHTMSVGANADRDFMKAIAFAGDGIYVDVPGGATIASMEEQMLAAFAKIAANVPPPKLMNP